MGLFLPRGNDLPLLDHWGKGPGEQGAAGFCPKILLLQRANGAESFHRSHREIRTRNWSISWSRRYAERIWGEFFILVKLAPANFRKNCRRISQRILMANFDGEFFGLVFPGFQATPKNSRPKFTSRIVSIPLQFHFLEPKIYSRRFSAHGEDQNI